MIIGKKKLISCDVQPYYSGGIDFKISDFVKYLNRFDKILYFFNGKDINVPDTKESVIAWLKENGMSDELLKKITFYEKVYWYFRDIMDTYKITHKKCVALLKLMIMLNQPNAAKIPLPLLTRCLDNPTLAANIALGKMKFVADFDMMYELLNWKNSILVGGLRNQCLAEIEVYCDALELNETNDPKFIYGQGVR